MFRRGKDLTRLSEENNRTNMVGKNTHIQEICYFKDTYRGIDMFDNKDDNSSKPEESKMSLKVDVILSVFRPC